MGEGLILLSNGHILVIKERYEPSFIEFGPAGSLPQGYGKDLALGADQEFPIQSEQFSLFPLKVWKITKNFSNFDLISISLGPDGSMYALSQQCRWIARIPGLDPESTQAGFSAVWSLPSKITKAEAFIVPDENHIVVAEDKKSIKKPNLFILEKPGSETRAPALLPPGT